MISPAAACSAGRCAGLGLVGSAGLAFYEFPAIASAEAARAGFRRALDALPTVEADALVAEAREAFGLNLRLFEAIGPERATTT